MHKEIILKLFGHSEVRANLVRGAIGSLGVKLGNTLLGLVLAVLLARHLGAAGMGTYAFVLAAASLIAIPTQLGLPTLVVRETAKAQANAQWGMMRGLWRWATLTVGSISLLLVIVALLIGLGFASHFEANERATFAWGIILVPLIALGNLRGAALRGLRRTVLGLLPELILRPGLLSIMVFAAALYFSPSALTSAEAMGLHVVAAALAFVIGALLLWWSRPPELNDRPHPEYQTREWFASALPLALVSGMQLINQNTDIILLGLMCSKEEVGVYKVVVTGAALVVFGLQAITLSLSPHFARLYTQGDKQRLQRLVTLSARCILVFALPIVLVLVVWGEAVLHMVFGAEYAEGKTALAILALGQLLNAGMGSVGMLLSMTGHEREMARAVMIGAVLNVILNLVLIPLWGINGAALSGTLTLMLWNLVMWRAVHRHLGIESMAFNLFSTKKSS